MLSKNLLSLSATTHSVTNRRTDDSMMPVADRTVCKNFPRLNFKADSMLHGYSRQRSFTETATFLVAITFTNGDRV